ncbi:Galactose-3-O-sulfotransferase 3-like [Oopsacas minuta]|uniref:Galactose-3-O-sulfotransferase 3-like n=1 Tax=Oopsacas minuta TaxID=111878 RepID=A0AAV7JU12_9METZ|nr:Galactose-3-O-sulfotransferase 3-like [Oopsacas minuta]
MLSTTKIIAILRHPATQLKSGFKYYGVSSIYPDGALSFNEFIDDPVSHLKKMYELKNLLWNGMSVDLGLMNNKNIPWLITKSDIISNHVLRTYVYDFLTSIEESIDLMLISEYFEESLVLLKRLLNWNLEDMAFFSLNKAVESVTIDQFTDAEMDKIIEWNFIDYLLYTRMLNKLFQQIYYSDVDINKDVIELKSINSYFKEYCLAEVKMDPRLYGAVPILGYKLNREGEMVEKCKLMTTTELKNIREARAHMKELCKSGTE